MKHAVALALAVALFATANVALAATDTPVGTWKTIDDATHQPKSIVQITEDNGKLQGKIVQLLNRSAEDVARDGEHPKCTKCSGALKDKPIEGMTFMWGLTRNGDVWDGGKIVDPKNGKEYKVKLTLTNGGNSLDVHGYIGFSLLGRTQTWQRQE